MLLAGYGMNYTIPYIVFIVSDGIAEAIAAVPSLKFRPESKIRTKLMNEYMKLKHAQEKNLAQLNQQVPEEGKGKGRGKGKSNKLGPKAKRKLLKTPEKEGQGDRETRRDQEAEEDHQ